MFGSLFSSEKIVDNATTAIDKAVFTEQEKTTFLVKAMEATLPMAISRRILSFAVSFVWGFLVMLWAVLVCFDLEERADRIAEGIGDFVATPFSIIVGFYFLKTITDRLQK